MSSSKQFPFLYTSYQAPFRPPSNTIEKRFLVLIDLYSIYGPANLNMRCVATKKNPIYQKLNIVLVNSNNHAGYILIKPKR